MVVGRSPQVRDRTDAGAFVVFAEPLPVGTSLVFKIDDKEQHARVTEVVESADASAAGMRVRFVRAGRTARARAGAARCAPPAAARAARSAPAAAPRRAPAAAPPPHRPPPVAARRSRRRARRPRPGRRPSPVGAAEAGDRFRGFGRRVRRPVTSSAQHAADSHGHHDGEHGRRTPPPEVIRPPRLAPGDPVRVIAPSGPVPREAFAAGIEVLRARYDVRYDDGVFARDGLPRRLR